MTTVEQQTESAIRPYHVAFPEEALADLRRRLAATRWPPREQARAERFVEPPPCRGRTVSAMSLIRGDPDLHDCLR